MWEGEGAIGATMSSSRTSRTSAEAVRNGCRPQQHELFSSKSTLSNRRLEMPYTDGVACVYSL